MDMSICGGGSRCATDKGQSRDRTFAPGKLLNIEEHCSCLAVLTHEVREMMLDEPVRQYLAMSARIETEETNMQTNEDRLKLNLANGNRIA